MRRNAGDLPVARAAEELAASIRPLAAGIVYNLALVCRVQREDAQALCCCDRILALAPGFDPARRLRAAIVTPTS